MADEIKSGIGEIEKQRKPEDWTREEEGRFFEDLHRRFFNHPSDEEWENTGSLAQPSTLKQVDSYGSSSSKPMKNPYDPSEK